MEARIGSKLKILYIVDILRKFSDEENPINASEICDKLAEFGVKAERKAIYDDIENLIFYGYDIIKTRTPRAGYFLASREFELPEIYLLTDAVQSADFITPKKTRELVGKLEGMMSKEQAKARENSIYIEYKNKCDNEEIYFSIDTLRLAIETGKKVTLKYRKRKIDENRKITVSEKEFKISPYALIWMEDHYYLVGNNEKYDNLMHLRLDRMKSVRCTEENYRHFSEVCSYKERFDTADYALKTFNMFGGELREIELSCNAKILEQVIDRFGDKIHIIGTENGRFSFRTKGLVSEGLVGWIMEFGGDIEVVAPADLRAMIGEKLTLLQKMYIKD
ncbi:MAG: WYL domain-containing transcriptional regulator [Clostridia bacterium]|nr:WYL domain-containing transcriptional regulator [Clostridia bacterium]